MPTTVEAAGKWKLPGKTGVGVHRQKTTLTGILFKALLMTNCN